MAAIMEGVEGCPTEAVRNDGDLHDWNQEPIIDWNERLRRYGYDVDFEIAVPVVPFEDTAEEERIAMSKWMGENKKAWWKRLFHG